MFVLVKRNPERTVIGERGDGVLLDGVGNPVACVSCGNPATRRFEYRDPDNCTALRKQGQLDDPPSFIDGYCSECYEHFQDSNTEGYFYCDGCQEYHIENYSWEKFYAPDEVDGGILCLACSENQVADKFDDIALHPGDDVPDDLEGFTVRLGGHQRPISDRFEVVAEFDGVAPYSDAPTHIREVVARLRELLADDDSPPLAVAVTNAYQFCVDMAIVKLREEV